MTSIRCRRSTKNTQRCKFTRATHPTVDLISLQNHNNATLFWLRNTLRTFTNSRPKANRHSETSGSHSAMLAPRFSVLPGKGCWCTAAAARQGASPGWWPAEPWGAAPSGWGCPAGREPEPRRHTSWTENPLKTGLHIAAGPLRCNLLMGQKKKGVKLSKTFLFKHKNNWICKFSSQYHQPHDKVIHIIFCIFTAKWATVDL